MTAAKIGIIGGSGLYQMPELTDVDEIAIETPFGDPSDKFIVGTLEGERVAFPAATWPWPSVHAERAAVSREHLRHEVTRVSSAFSRRRRSVRCKSRYAPTGHGDSKSVFRSHASPRA
jgi:hypothetical protein